MPSEGSGRSGRRARQRLAQRAAKPVVRPLPARSDRRDVQTPDPNRDSDASTTPLWSCWNALAWATGAGPAGRRSYGQCRAAQDGARRTALLFPREMVETRHQSGRQEFCVPRQGREPIDRYRWGATGCFSAPVGLRCRRWTFDSGLYRPSTLAGPARFYPVAGHAGQCQLVHALLRGDRRAGCATIWTSTRFTR